MTGYGGTCVLLYYGKFSRTVKFLWISLLAQKLILQMLYHYGWNYWRGMKFDGWRNYFANNNIKKLKTPGTYALMWKYVFQIACIYNNM